MRSRGNMIAGGLKSVLDAHSVAAALLLGAVWVLCSNAVGVQSQACVSNREVVLFVPADYLNASSPVSVDVCLGKKLNISLEGFGGDPVCHWSRGKSLVMTINGSHSLDPKPQNGEYILECETSNGAKSSMTVYLHVMNRPTKPQMTLERVNVPLRSPLIKCISDGNPTPTITWLDIKGKKINVPSDKKTDSEISSSEYHDKGVMCCATNPEGQECSQLYDYDLDSDLMEKDEVSNVTVSPDQSVLLRCRFKNKDKVFPVWEKGSEILDKSTLACSSNYDKEICFRNDKHFNSRMVYLFIKSVNMNHSGTYTCTGQKNKTKSVYIHVQAKGFLSVQLNKNIIIPSEEASHSCLVANVSYHPVLQYCSWEVPNKTMTECMRDTWVTKHRTVKLCGSFNSGDYKLHLEAGGQKVTKTISVCIAEKPVFKWNDIGSTITSETVSLVPANYTWMSCSSSNDSETDSSCKEIPGTSQTDSDILCYKTIKSSLNKELVKGPLLKFCITNSVGSSCESAHFSVSLQARKGAPDADDSSVVLKIGIFVLLHALAVLSVVLVYFVKKKKPQYQPQLQIIQMVGPNDNDYIYINFRDFEYDLKWEFPRENLELGEELGSGAFGMVVQATAYGISKPGNSRQVAVKMLKEKHQAVEKEALMSELKMLIHIGHHTNIVNLLGACTESGPIYLIFQYCCYGDLLNYLKTNSERYHKSVTDAFNKDRFSSLYHNLQLRKSELEADDYIPMHRSTTRGQEEIALLNLSCADMDTCEEIFENPDDHADDLQALTFDDLLSFAFQVAKGMEFLSAKNCIHRDLAARNVLVTKGRLVKIGDFGLARDIDNDSNYVVRGNVRLPVKWMAPESIFQGMYTMKSDVWAYGVLLWEIFSLGVTPYPGIKVDHTFYSKIEKGFKMECPYYATDFVYRIMCECWDLDPNNRPSFSKLVSFMCCQLTDREEKLYHNMLEKTSCDYQNAPAILDISALTKQDNKETQLGNDYCRTNSTEERKAEMCHSDTLAAEEKLLKLTDGE